METGGHEAHHSHHSRSSSFDTERREGEEEKEIQTTQHRRGGWARLFGGWDASHPDSLPLVHVRELKPKPFVRRAGSKIYNTCVFLLPSFLQPRQHSNRRDGEGSQNNTQNKPLHPTAYLDGLRGVAALVVYVFHFGYLWFPFLRDGYGAPGSDDSLWQITGVRVFHSGRGSVTLFFVLSGYVVTAKTVAKIHQNQQRQRQRQRQRLQAPASEGQQQQHSGQEQEVAQGHCQVLLSLSGSLFRRPFRLYLPIIASTLIILALVRTQSAFPAGTGPPFIEGGLGAQLGHWLEHTGHTINPFRPITGRAGTYSPPYDGHLWTIPVEFKGSLTVFALLLAFAGVSGARLRLGTARLGFGIGGRWIRIAAEVGAGLWLVKMGDFDQALFCAGLFLVEMSLIIPPSSLSSPWSSGDDSSGHYTAPLSAPPPPSGEGTEDPQLELPPRRPHQRRGIMTTRVRAGIRHAWTLSLFALAVHLLGWPETKGPSTPGYRTLARWVPAAYGDEERIQQFWISVGAILFVIALMYSPPAGRLRPRWADRLGLACRHRVADFCTDVVRAAHPGFRRSEPGPGGHCVVHDGEDEKGAATYVEPLLQRPFTTRFAQYLGRISYALYLAHGAVNDAVCMRLLATAQAAWAQDHAAYNELRTSISASYSGGHGLSESAVQGYDEEMRAAEATKSQAYLRYCGRAALATLVNTLVLIWVSDVFWRAVDVRSVNVTRRLWGWASGLNSGRNAK